MKTKEKSLKKHIQPHLRISEVQFKIFIFGFNTTLTTVTRTVIRQHGSQTQMALYCVIAVMTKSQM